MQKVYMLTEEEYSMLQGQAKYIEHLQKESSELQRRLNIALESRRTLSEQLAKAKQDGHLTSDIARDSIKERDERIEALKKENEHLSHRLAVANESREKDRQQINGLYEKVKTYRETYDTMNKTLCEKAHKILVLEAEAAELSRKLRDAQELLGLVPDDALTIAKLTQLASMGK